MAISFLSDHLADARTRSLPFNADPIKLARDDIALFFHEFFSLPDTILPWAGTYPDDELTFNFWNNYCIVLHGILIFWQIGFILIVLLAPFFFVIPLTLFLVCFFGFLILNYFFCKKLLNGPALIESSVEEQIRDYRRPEHREEKWIFLNGVSVGSHWLKSNVNRLSKTFCRPVLGVHNPTAGIVFDVIQCLIQRCFCYATLDIRNAYVQVKDALEDPQYKKVIFIVHSQGAIEGSMIVDWLLDEVPQDLLYQLEVYTFGNASNHMNNPHKSTDSLNVAKNKPSPTSTNKPLAIDTHAVINSDSSRSSTVSSNRQKAIGHIEHYVHSEDFVARWGVLHFTKPPAPTPANASVPNDPYINRFMGQVFIQKASGHMLNQHYLETMFTLDRKTGVGCDENNSFMDQRISTTESDDDAINHQTNIVDSMVEVLQQGGTPQRGVNVRNVGSPQAVRFPNVRRTDTGSFDLKVKDLSRLWKYRNGGSPDWPVQKLAS